MTICARATSPSGGTQRALHCVRLLRPVASGIACGPRYRYCHPYQNSRARALLLRCEEGSRDGDQSWRAAVVVLKLTATGASRDGETERLTAARLARILDRPTARERVHPGAPISKPIRPAVLRGASRTQYRPGVPSSSTVTDSSFGARLCAASDSSKGGERARKTRARQGISCFCDPLHRGQGA